jgi:signal transduction histidine kinase
MNSSGRQVNRRILVIDDDEGTHRSFRKILGPQRRSAALAALEATLFGESHRTEPVAFQVDSAYQGEDGLEMLRRARDEARPYAMAFVDVRMPPGWDGVTTLRKLWSEDDRLQAVICTAFSDYSWDDIARRLGQSDRLLVLKKPFDVVEVRQMAWAATERWNLQREVEARLAEARASVRARDELVAAASRALRRPLAPLMLRVQYLHRALRAGALSSVPPGTVERFLDASERQVAHLSALVNDLLDASRLGAGAPPREPPAGVEGPPAP